jgi:hypothetical protein
VQCCFPLPLQAFPEQAKLAVSRCFLITVFPHCPAEVFTLVFAAAAVLIDFAKLKNAMLAIVAIETTFLINLINQ